MLLLFAAYQQCVVAALFGGFKRHCGEYECMLRDNWIGVCAKHMYTWAGVREKQILDNKATSFSGPSLGKLDCRDN